MHKIFLVLISFLGWHSSHAQYQLLDQTSHNISAEINLINGELSVNQDAMLSSSMISDLNVSLVHGDIIIDYRFQRGDDGQNYKVSFNANLNGQDLILYREDIIGSIDEDVSADLTESQQLIWTGLLDRYIDLNGTLLLSLNVQLWGQPQLPYGIECGVLPEFSMKQKLPYFIAAGVGLGSLGASLIFKNKSDDTYNNDYLSQNFQEAAEPFYQQANDDHQKSLIFRYAGIGILAVDAGMYIFRLIRHQKKRNAYDEFCKENAVIQVQPIFEVPQNEVSPGQLGFRITYTFGQ